MPVYDIGRVSIGINNPYLPKVTTTPRPPTPTPPEPSFKIFISNDGYLIEDGYLTLDGDLIE